MNIEVKFLKALYNKAISWGKADKNPVKEVTLFPEDSGRVRYLEKDKIGQLVKACSDHLRPIVITALNTGMRKREILDLKWSDVDLYRKTIYIIRSKGGRQREVPINSVLYQMLCLLEEKEGVSSYVFANREGRPYGNITKSFKSALKAAGIKNFRFHDLRHTFASHLVMSGVDLIDSAGTFGSPIDYDDFTVCSFVTRSQTASSGTIVQRNGHQGKMLSVM